MQGDQSSKVKKKLYSQLKTENWSTRLSTGHEQNVHKELRSTPSLKTENWSTGRSTGREQNVHKELQSTVRSTAQKKAAAREGIGRPGGRSTEIVRSYLKYRLTDRSISRP